MGAVAKNQSHKFETGMTQKRKKPIGPLIAIFCLFLLCRPVVAQLHPRERVY